jgi:hypothetical protein
MVKSKPRADSPSRTSPQHKAKEKACVVGLPTTSESLMTKQVWQGQIYKPRGTKKKSETK